VEAFVTAASARFAIMQENTEIHTYVCLISLLCKNPLLYLLLTVMLLFHTCFHRVKIRTLKSLSGRICRISLYEQAKRTYLGRLKVKKIFMLKFLI